MFNQDCYDTGRMILEPHPDDNQIGLIKKFTLKIDEQDNTSPESIIKNFQSLHIESEMETTQQDVVIKHKIFDISDEIISSPRFLNIPLCNILIRKLLKADSISFKYSEFLDKKRCLMDCATAPHTIEQLINIGKVIPEIEFHLSKINLMYDNNLRPNVDSCGWIKCDFIYRYLSFEDMNVTYNDFIIGLKHSPIISFDDSETYIRANDFTKLTEYNNKAHLNNIFKSISLIPRGGFIHADDVRTVMTIRGCHQKMVKAFNYQMYIQLSGKVPDVSIYYIHHIPEENQFDKYLEYL